jgi:uncharacterized coiled-coil protein SlyX
MNAKSTEERLNVLEETIGKQQKYIKTLEKKLTALEDIEAIKRLQKAYNYYVEHMMGPEIIDCFSDSKNVVLNWLEGQWLGKEGVKRYFGRIASGDNPPGFSHQLMPTGGLITLDPDGKTAKGRWYAFGGIFMAQDGKVDRGSLTSGIYEMGYIKENGIWKILSIRWVIPYSARIAEWGLPEQLGERLIKGEGGRPEAPMPQPDIPIDKNDLRYVSGYIFPFHFKHPVTGKETTEAARNARLKPLKID